MKQLILLTFLGIPFFSGAQENSFKFGHITYEELGMTRYERDTSARAVVLEEFGEAYIDNGSGNNLIFEHHFKIKILKKSGLDLANYSISLFKYSSQAMDVLLEVKASSFTLESGRIVETALDKKNVYTEKYENGSIKKFAIPNVVVGSIIEIQYKLERPNIFNFKRWEFQWDIPKVKSEYWALIPANYVYNIALRGFLQLSKQDSELKRDCFRPGGNKADCTLMRFAMENIPAFIEEEYMTTSKNYISSINFELSEVKYFSGAVDKISKEWKDVEEELRREQRFGLQLKRGEDIVGRALQLILAEKSDRLEKAKSVYDFVVSHYTWNGEFSKYCENGIKKAFEEGKGNVGDINLSLIAALRYAGLEADPIIMSTRENGYPTDLYPVLSEFNYVIAKLTIGESVYLLDATDPLMPFGMVPFRCLNGKGRVIGDRKTSWHEIAPPDKFKKICYIKLKLESDGVLSGMIQRTFMGYDAYNKRREIFSHNNLEEYKKSTERKFTSGKLKGIEVKNLESITEPLSETIEVEIDGYDLNATFLLNPFLVDKKESNPFKSSERLYPVDFGSTIDERFTLSIEFPETIQVVNVPENVALSLPNSGGRYIFSARLEGNVLLISSWLNTNKPLFSSEEYHYLKELYNWIVQVQNTDIIFRKG